jgi:hypothetical protein
MISRTSVLLALVLPVLGATEGNHPVDARLAEAWAAADVEPAPLAGDAEFLRRASLDLAGRVPTLEELRAFLAKPDRAAKIDELLAGPEFPRFWSEVWTAMLVGYAPAFDANRQALRLWLEKALRENRPFDRIAADLVAAEGLSNVDGPANFVLHHSVEPAIKVSRAFLGIRLDCARCHDHPFDRWTQEDYKAMARFFAPVERQEIANGSVRVRDNPEKAGGAKPKFLTGSSPVTTRWRQELAFFMTRSRAFARPFANRLWYHFMGRGIVDPPDDFTLKNQPSVPALLDFLAGEASRREFDLRAMVRLICSSDAYRRSSRGRERDARREALFAVRGVKPLTPEQVFDSLVSALESEDLRPRRAAFIKAFVGRSFGEDFTNVWTYRESVQDLMTKLSIDPRAPAGTLEDLYLRLLSRPPSPRERELCRGREPAEIAFALAHSNEFFFNH